MGHTQGPWAISKHGNDYGIYAEHQQTFTLALVRDTGNDEVHENAALIAAAPDLLAALEEVGTWLISPDTSPDTIDAMRGICRAAIARAQGVQ